MTSSAKLAIGLGAAVVAVLLVTLASRDTPAAPSPASPTPAVPAAPLPTLISERTKGDSAAPITIWEFSDFQCPYCRDFAVDVLPALEREYLRTGKARLIFAHFPIPSLHANAQQAHEFAACVSREKKFWPYHDLLFRHQKKWEKLSDPAEYLRGLVDSVGLNSMAIAGCVEMHVLGWLVSGEAYEARKVGITATPSFVVEGNLLRGAIPMSGWRPFLDSIYAAKTGSGRQQR